MVERNRNLRGFADVIGIGPGSVSMHANLYFQREEQAMEVVQRSRDLSLPFYSRNIEVSTHRNNPVCVHNIYFDNRVDFRQFRFLFSLFRI